MSQVIFKETAERLSMSARQVIVCPSVTIVCMCKIVCECDDICVMCYGSRCRFTKCYNPYQPVHYLCRCLGNNSTNLVISPFCFCSGFYNCFMNAVSMEFFRTRSYCGDFAIPALRQTHIKYILALMACSKEPRYYRSYIMKLVGADDQLMRCATIGDAYCIVIVQKHVHDASDKVSISCIRT